MVVHRVEAPSPEEEAGDHLDDEATEHDEPEEGWEEVAG